MENDLSTKDFEYRPVRPFIQIPEKVLMYVLQLTPSSFAKVYLYLYNISYGAGYNKTFMYTSVREIAKNLNISIGRVHNSITYFKKIGAIEKIVSKAVLGTKFLVNVPEFSSTKKVWYFTKPEKVHYLMMKERLITNEKIVMAKVKRYKSKKEVQKIELFDNKNKK